MVIPIPPPEIYLPHFFPDQVKLNFHISNSWAMESLAPWLAVKAQVLKNRILKPPKYQSSLPNALFHFDAF